MVVAKHPEAVAFEERARTAADDNFQTQTKTSAGGEDDDACSIMSSSHISTRDPITKQPMTDPVKNKKCGHTYEKKSILELMLNSRGKVRCPCVGCGNKDAVREDDLEPDREMKKAILAKKKDAGGRR
jgi:SUMO ligase MMS21 Smc5/6 complex component